MRRGPIIGIVVAVVALIVLVVLVSKRDQPQQEPAQPAADAFALTSPAFEDGQSIPVRYTCDSDDVSPPLEWKNAPEGTASFALIVLDPDAPGPGDFVHWLICDIPARTAGLAEGVPKQETLSAPMGAVQGNNGFRKIGYGGPCPPKGDEAHRYVFTLYALGAKTEIPGAYTRHQFRAAIAEAKVLAEAELTGTYRRQ